MGAVTLTIPGDVVRTQAGRKDGQRPLVVRPRRFGIAHAFQQKAQVADQKILQATGLLLAEFNLRLIILRVP